MKTYTIEFDSTELLKLNAICSAAIASEEKHLALVPTDSMTKQSIKNIKSIKAKIKNAILYNSTKLML